MNRFQNFLVFWKAESFLFLFLSFPAEKTNSFPAFGEDGNKKVVLELHLNDFSYFYSFLAERKIDKYWKSWLSQFTIQRCIANASARQKECDNSQNWKMRKHFNISREDWNQYFEQVRFLNHFFVLNCFTSGEGVGFSCWKQNKQKEHTLSFPEH